VIHILDNAVQIPAFAAGSFLPDERPRLLPGNLLPMPLLHMLDEGVDEFLLGPMLVPPAVAADGLGHF